MPKTRKRQFNDIRSQMSARSSRSVSLSENSSDYEACITCINRLMASNQFQRKKSQKEQERYEERKRLHELNSIVDENQIRRQHEENEALKHNGKMIEDHKNINLRQKQADTRYVRERQDKNKEAIKQMLKVREIQEKRIREYRKEIHKQYLQNMKKKEQEKIRMRKPQKEQGLPIYQKNDFNQRLSHTMELKKQIEDNQQKKKQEKIQKEEDQRRLLREYDQQAIKYHADTYHLRDTKNPQIFNEMKELEKKKKNQINSERKKNQLQRTQLLRRQNQQRAQQIEYKMKQMQKYVHELKNQIKGKEQYSRKIKKEEDSFREKFPKSTEEVAKEFEVRKKCNSCKLSYSQEYIDKIPKIF